MERGSPRFRESPAPEMSLSDPFVIKPAPANGEQVSLQLYKTPPEPQNSVTSECNGWCNFLYNRYFYQHENNEDLCFNQKSKRSSFKSYLFLQQSRLEPGVGSANEQQDSRALHQDFISFKRHMFQIKVNISKVLYQIKAPCNHNTPESTSATLCLYSGRLLDYRSSTCTAETLDCVTVHVV